jgi:hypothetical protein
MSFTDRAILWLHIGVAIFTIGPVTAAIMSTPRYIRKRNAVVVGFLRRMTWMYGVASLLVFVFGAVLASMRDSISQPWVSISMTLFVVALVLMYLIARDQGKAVEALDREAQVAAAAKAAVPATTAQAVPAADAAPTAKEGETDVRDGKTAPQPAAPVTVPSDIREDDRIAAVERGRIASMGGITAIIWVVILILMVWK